MSALNPANAEAPPPYALPQRSDASPTPHAAQELTAVQDAIDAGDLVGAVSRLEALLDHARQGRHDELLARAHLLRSTCALNTRDIEVGATHAATGLAIAERLGLPFLRAQAQVASARIYYAIGEFSSALAELEQAREVAAQGEDGALCFDFHNLLGNIHMALDHFDECISLGEVALGVAQRIGDLRRQATATGNLGGRWYSRGASLLQGGQTEEGRAALLRSLALNEEAIPLAERAGAPLLNLVHLTNVASALAALQRDEEALAAFARHQELASRLGLPATRAFALVAEARLEHRRGQSARARALAQEGIETAESLRVRAILPELYELASLIDEEQGRLADALSLYKRMYTTRAQSASDAAELRSRVLAVRLATERAQREAADERARAEALRLANQALERRAEDLSREALEDALTGLANRRQLDLHLSRMHAQALESGTPACVAILDIDFFKQVNDRFSHAVGDRVLQQVGQILAAQCRQGDLPARCGGEEFVICWLGVDLDGAGAACERVREAIACHDWGSIAPGLAVTASLGLTDSAWHATPGDALAAADERLYEAKRSGRNRVCTDPGAVRGASTSGAGSIH